VSPASTKPDPLDNYDWKSAFIEARLEITPVLQSLAKAKPFTIEDVAKVIALSPRENDCRDWIAVVRLKDKRFVAVIAGCDYTGWDCRAWGKALVAMNLRELKKYGLTEEEKKRLWP